MITRTICVKNKPTLEKYKKNIDLRICAKINNIPFNKTFDKFIFKIELCKKLTCNCLKIIYFSYIIKRIF